MPLAGNGEQGSLVERALELAIDAAIETATDARAALVMEIQQLRATRREGDDAVHALAAPGWTSVRQTTSETLALHQHQVRVLRATVIRSLVDDSRLTISEAARRLGISRQLASRLYAEAMARPPTAG